MITAITEPGQSPWCTNYLVSELGNEWQLLPKDKGHDILGIELAIIGSPSFIKLLEHHHTVRSGLQWLGHCLVCDYAKVDGVLGISCIDVSLGLFRFLVLEETDHHHVVLVDKCLGFFCSLQGISRRACPLDQPGDNFLCCAPTCSRLKWKWTTSRKSALWGQSLHWA